MISESEAAAYRTGTGTAERTRWLAGVLAARVLPGGRALEIGAGGLADYLGAICVEPEPALWPACGGRVVGGAPNRLPVCSAGLDTVVASATRLLRGPDVFAEIARVLRPGGAFRCVLPRADAPVTDPIGKILAPMRAALRPASRGSGRDALAASAAAAGLRADIAALEPYSYRQAPAGEATDLRNRASSLLWSVGDETWLQVVVPAIAALEALPCPDRAITRYAYWELLTARR